MSEFRSTPESISHKQLNSLLSKARKQPVHAHEQANLFSEKQKEFEDFITEWQTLSEELLNKLNKKQNYIVEKRTPQSLMALGALEAHLKMAINAKHASDLN